MPILKLTSVASLYGKPCKLNQWFRSLAAPIDTVSFPTSICCTGRFTSPVVRQRCSVPLTRDCRISPCVTLLPPSHDKFSYGKLGFRRQRYCVSSEVKRVVVSNVVPDDKDDELGLDGELNTHSTLPAKKHHHSQESSPVQQSQPAKLLTLPTILTIARVIAVPLLVSTFYVDSWWGTTATTGIFVTASITDWLDGYIARKKKLGTAFGAFLDPVADKLMVAATLVLLCTRPLEVAMFGEISWILTLPSIAIIGREITISAVREWAAFQNGKLSQAVAVNNLGKWKTATQMTSLTILLATRDSSLTGAGTLVATGVLLLYISAWFALWSLVVYMKKIWKVLLML